MTPIFSNSQINSYRKKTFRTASAASVLDLEEALRFLNERGFIFFWPIKGVILPSLWAAAAGDRPVADAHDDPGHITWRWKDDMLDKKKWYYAKLLRGKSTIVSMETIAYFYALSENFGDPEDDYLQQYSEGLLSREAKLIYEALLHHGPLNTVRLRKVCQLSGKASSNSFERGLTALQRDLKILPIGVAEAGAWRYSFVYELVHRHFPELPEKAREIKRGEAQENLVDLYFASVGAARVTDVRKLFHWSPGLVNNTLEMLVGAGQIKGVYIIDGHQGDYYIYRELAP